MDAAKPQFPGLVGEMVFIPVLMIPRDSFAVKTEKARLCIKEISKLNQTK